MLRGTTFAVQNSPFSLREKGVGGMRENLSGGEALLASDLQFASQDFGLYDQLNGAPFCPLNQIMNA